MNNTLVCLLILSFEPLNCPSSFFLFDSSSPRFPDSVSIIGDIVEGLFQPVGTCFAVSPQYLLTVQHNIQSNRRGGYVIAPYASRIAGAVVVPLGFPCPVRVRFFNRAMDYAILELCDNCFDLAPIPKRCCIGCHIRRKMYLR